jgi:hypothetical protein
MIIFNTEFTEYINKKLHRFLHTEFIDAYKDEESIEVLDGFFPSYLIREQPEKCFTTFEELFEWTGDRYWHRMTAFHEIGLFYFLEYIKDLRKDEPAFDSIYYDAEDEKDLEALWEKLDIYALFEGSMKNTSDLATYLRDIGTLQEYCFEDTDFLLVDRLSNLHSIGDYSIEETMGIDFDYYKDILPRDIQAQHGINKLPLLNEVERMLEHVSHNITYRGLHASFWNDDKPRSEREVQPLLDSLFDLYLKGDQSADITREADVGTGKVDFKFYRNTKEKVLIEVKLGSNPKLEHGLEKQLIHYMNSIRYDHAFYLIICHSNQDVASVDKLYEKYKNYNFGKHITICALDVSKKKTASKK